MPGRLTRLRAGLPLDGQGLSPPPDPDLARLRRWAAALAWRRAPWWAQGWGRPLAIAAARTAWAAAAVWRAARFGRRQGLPAGERLRLAGDCLAAGARPVDAWVWRRLFSSPHPLPDRAAGLLLSRLGDPAQHQLLCDKLATAEHLAGLATPRLIGLLRQGETAAATAYLWAQPGGLFVKPRCAAAGRNAFQVDVLEAGRYRIDGGPAVDFAALAQRLAAAADEGDLLAQQRLEAAVELADLAADGRPPVLRLTVARRPGEAAFLHSALLAVPVPGESPRHFLRGQLWTPVDPINGRLGEGVWLQRPAERCRRLPWNGAALTGRATPDFTAAAAMALAAAARLPDLALINWDMVPTPAGPVILEGNSMGNWLLTQLPATQGLAAATALPPLLDRWRTAAQSRPAPHRRFFSVHNR